MSVVPLGAAFRRAELSRSAPVVWDNGSAALRTEGKRHVFDHFRCVILHSSSPSSFFAVSVAFSVENFKKHTKRGKVKIGLAPPGYIVFAASDFRLPLFLPEQAKAYEKFRIARFFTRFGSFRGKRKAPEPKPRCLCIHLVHFAPILLGPPAYEFCVFSHERGHRSTDDFTTEK